MFLNVLFPVSEINPSGELKTQALEISEMTYLGLIEEATLIAYPEDPYTFPYKKITIIYFFSVVLQHNITETAQHDKLLMMSCSLAST